MAGVGDGGGVGELVHGRRVGGRRVGNVVDEREGRRGCGGMEEHGAAPAAAVLGEVLGAGQGHLGGVGDGGGARHGQRVGRDAVAQGVRHVVRPQDAAVGGRVAEAADLVAERVLDGVVALSRLGVPVTGLT